MARIFEVKGRPTGHPLIVHLGDVTELDDWSDEPSADARRLARLAWPGPLTIIVPRHVAFPTRSPEAAIRSASGYRRTR